MDLGNRMTIEHLLILFLGILSVMIVEVLIHFPISSNNDNRGRSRVQGISDKRIRTTGAEFFLQNSYGP